MNRLFVVLLLSSCAHATIQAATIYSTFGPGDSYVVCCGFGNVAPTAIAYPFNVPTDSNFVFTGAKLALSQGIGDINAVDISLATDASDQPGTVLETIHVAGELGPAGADTPPIVVSSTLRPALLAGGEYWLIEIPSVAGNGVNWQAALAVPSPPRIATRNGNAPWVVNSIPVSYLGAFSISADPSTSTTTTPEPATSTLMLAGIVGLGFKRLAQKCRP